MTVAAAPADFQMGRVISRLFGVLSRNIVLFLLLSALLVGLPTGIFGYLQLGAVTPLTGAAPGDPSAVMGDLFSPLRIGVGAAAWLASVIGNAVLQGAVIHATVSDLSGRRPAFGECLGTGFRFFLPLVMIGLIFGICFVIGLIFFIVPGVLLALAWCVAAPAEVMERTGIFGSFSRSAELTRNHRAVILVLALALGIAEWVLQSIISGVLGVGIGASAAATPGLAGGAFQSFYVFQTIVSLALATLFASISQAGVASVYFELRHAKEGIGVEQLAAVFD
ncbi:MAG TPA: hypothetical protein VHS81_00345 [Caulobacteraceae bacterium]|nr:hypothetical protein [Caulobacteraceae bacterium]